MSMDLEIRTAAGLRWLDEGSGPVVLAVHGLLGDPDNWRSVVDRVQPHCRIVVPRLPYRSLSREEATVDGVVRILGRLVEHLNLTGINLIGNSLGGQVALLYGVANPGRVRTVTLTGSAGLGERALNEAVQWQDYRLSRMDRALVRRLVERTFYDPAVATPELVDHVYATINDETTMLPLLQFAKSSRHDTIGSVLGVVPHPVCLIWGRNDVITPPDIAEAFQRALPRAELFWIDRCGHAPMMEHPDAFTRTLLDWLARQGVLSPAVPAD